MRERRTSHEACQGDHVAQGRNDRDMPFQHCESHCEREVAVDDGRGILLSTFRGGKMHHCLEMTMGALCVRECPSTRTRGCSVFACRTAFEIQDGDCAPTRRGIIGSHSNFYLLAASTLLIVICYATTTPVGCDDSVEHRGDQSRRSILRCLARISAGLVGLGSYIVQR